MNAKSMHELKEMLCNELEELVRKGSVSRTDIEPIESITTSIKNLMKINEMEEGGYSYGMGDWNANGSYSNRGYSNDGYSGRPYYGNNGSYGNDSMSGRMHYVRGHYSRGDMITDRIEEMMDDDRLSSSDKEALRRAMDVLRK